MFEDDIEADDIPNPSENQADEITEEEEEEYEEAAAETIEYAFNDEDSLLYVQVWKDESAAASGFAHNHVMRATNFDGIVSYNRDDIDECTFDFTVPVYDLAVDRKSNFSGVDLDTEAARLLEQQQAYQALAKVLSTAKEMVDTLLRFM